MRRALTAAAAAAALLLPAAPAAAQFSPAPFTNQPGAVTRIGGDTPAAYAVELSRAVNEFPVDAAVIVSDAAFADALAASALTSFGSIFFASPGQPLDAETLAEVDRVVDPQAGEFTLVGGTAVVDPQVEAQLAALQGNRPVIRLAGPTRYETAVAVADYAIGDDAEPATYEVFVARAFGPEGNPTAAWADSVAIGPAAAASRTPILFTPTDELHPSVSGWLDGRAPRRATVLGGEAAISADVADAIDAPVRRVAGSSRDETAVRILHQVVRDGYANPLPIALVNLFDPQGWAYGLATAPVVGIAGGGILAINPVVDSAVTQGVVACTRPTEVLVAGPQAQVSDDRVAGAQTCQGGDAASEPGSPIQLRGDGLGGDVDFGLRADATIAALTRTFGEPTGDTGRLQPACELAGPDGPAGRAVTFDGGLTALFAEARAGTADEMFFDGWAYEGDGLSTDAAVAVGDTLRVLEAAYGHDAILFEGDPMGFPPPIAGVDTPIGPLDAILDGNTPNAQITALYGGRGLQFCE